VKRRRVQFTATARRHVLRERDWWITNREQAATFASDLDRTVNLIATLPGVSSNYTQVPGMRRVFVERIGVHVYFTFDDDSVTIRAVWGARRRRGPRLADALEGPG
jgi:plasmid stabilization system protein ParE